MGRRHQENSGVRSNTFKILPSLLHSMNYTVVKIDQPDWALLLPLGWGLLLRLECDLLFVLWIVLLLMLGEWSFVTLFIICPVNSSKVITPLEQKEHFPTQFIHNTFSQSWENKSGSGKPQGAAATQVFSQVPKCLDKAKFHGNKFVYKICTRKKSCVSVFK